MQHAQYLIEKYYLMPASSVDEISVFDLSRGDEDPEDNKMLTVPTLTITRSPDDGDDIKVTNEDKVVENYNLYNATSGWPLSKEGR